MKKLLLLPLLILAVHISAQEDVEFKGLRVARNMKDVSVYQTTVLFQNVTKRAIYVTERNALGSVLGRFAGSKSGGASMSADLTAYLVFSDGEPTDAEYQQVVDDFYNRLNEKLTQANIPATPWDSFASSDYYGTLAGEKDDDRETEEMTRKGNAWKIYTANRGPRAIRYNPMNHNYNVPAVRGTVRLGNFLKEANVSSAMALNIVVDFADIYLEGEAYSGSETRTFSTVDWQTTKVKYDLYPNIRITSRDNGGNQLFIFPSNRRFAEAFNSTDVRSTTDLRAETSQDESKIKQRGWFQVHIGHKHDITPFVVETTKQEYFNNVRNALDRYADELVKALQDATS